MLQNRSSTDAGILASAYATCSCVEQADQGLPFAGFGVSAHSVSAVSANTKRMRVLEDTEIIR